MMSCKCSRIQTLPSPFVHSVTKSDWPPLIMWQFLSFISNEKHQYYETLEENNLQLHNLLSIIEVAYSENVAEAGNTILWMSTLHSFPLSQIVSCTRVAYSIALTCLSTTQASVQLIDSTERADTLLSKRTGVEFKPVTLWLRTRGTNQYTSAALF